MLDNNVQFYSGSAGAMGFGVVFGTSWFYLCWHLEWNMDNNKLSRVCPYSVGVLPMARQTIRLQFNLPLSWPL